MECFWYKNFILPLGGRVRAGPDSAMTWEPEKWPPGYSGRMRASSQITPAARGPTRLAPAPAA
jgi:hypothetical protein